MRSRRRSASTGSRCAGATSSPRRRCRTGGRSTRSAPRSCSIPATMPLLLDKTLAAIGWDALQAKLSAAARRANWSAPASACSSRRAGSGRSTRCGSTVDGSGAVEVVTGAASVGQGIETVIAQICADTLGVDYARIRVIHGQTDRIEYGLGAFASRVTVMTGEATRRAASAVRAKAIDDGRRADAGASRRARHRRRRRRAHRRRRAPRSRSAMSRARWRRPPRRAASAIRASPPKAGSTPTT